MFRGSNYTWLKVDYGWLAPDSYGVTEVKIEDESKRWVIVGTNTLADLHLVPRDLTYTALCSHVGRVVTVGPYRLRLVQEYTAQWAYLAVRETRLAWATVLLWRLTQFWQRFEARLIMTLAVWGLARWHRESVPSWDDVHLVRRVKDWVKAR